MEYIDILNEKGEKTGEVKSKDEVHEKGLWHRATHVWFINSKNEILLQKRANKRAYPYFWDISVAGHISAGEDSLVSAEREILEEVGVVISKNDLVLIGIVKQSYVINDGNYINNEFDDIYVVKTNLEISDFKFNDGEVESVEYVSKELFKQWVQEGKDDLVPHPEEYDLLLKSI